MLVAGRMTESNAPGGLFFSLLVHECARFENSEIPSLATYVPTARGSSYRQWQHSQLSDSKVRLVDNTKRTFFPNGRNVDCCAALPSFGCYRVYYIMAHLVLQGFQRVDLLGRKPVQ